MDEYIHVDGQKDSDNGGGGSMMMVVKKVRFEPRNT